MLNKEGFIRTLAGTLVLLGVSAGHFYNEWFYLIPVFVALNLIQSSFTGVCPAEIAYDKAKE